MATSDANVKRWTNELKKATAEYNHAHYAIYGYECGHPYTKSEHDRLALAKQNVASMRERLADAKAVLETANGKAEYEKMWRYEPTIWEAYIKK